MKPEHKTNLGAYYVSDINLAFSRVPLKNLGGQVQLIFTSPPFPLNKKKSYGNLSGEAYLGWLADLAPHFARLLTEDGSIVLELGNAWEPGRPVQSLLPLEALLAFTKNPSANLRLCQKFVCYNPSRLPTPAQWVSVERSRAVDSYTNIWWLSRTDNPKADNSNVLRPYSDSMKQLLKRQSFNSGGRPSGHRISASAFKNDRGGSIAHNVIELEPMDPNRDVRLPNAMSFSNTVSNDFFSRTCKERGIRPHPARMPPQLAEFFIRFLTEPGDLVLDPFAGSNTTGLVAESLERKWMAFDAKPDYVDQSRLRFEDPKLRNSA